MPRRRSALLADRDEDELSQKTSVADMIRARAVRTRYHFSSELRPKYAIHQLSTATLATLPASLVHINRHCSLIAPPLCERKETLLSAREQGNLAVIKLITTEKYRDFEST